jgi:hypothetical protein
MSSPRSESIKGHITRVGTRIVKGVCHYFLLPLYHPPTLLLPFNSPSLSLSPPSLLKKKTDTNLQQLHLRLRTHAPITLSLSPDHPLLLPSLTSLRTLLNQSLDCIDITRWTGDRHSAHFISSQLHLLHSILQEALAILKGPILLVPTNPPTPPSDPIKTPPPTPIDTPWYEDPPSAESFTPPLPTTLSLHLSLTSPTLHLTLRVLEPTAVQPNNFSRFALAIGAQRRLEHDEMDEVFMYRGEEVRVREKVRVESSADPSLLSLGAKLGALERTLEASRGALRCVMGDSGGGEESD